MFVLISYDIVEDKKRLGVMRILKDYGTPVQKSVFECNLSKRTYGLVKAMIEDVINKQKDRVRYYRMCEGCRVRVEISGWGEITEDEEFVVV
jgi:CRISPR-associated protein Cas2